MILVRYPSLIEELFVILRHRHRICIMENKDLNRIKVMLAEKKRKEPTSGLQNNLAKTLQQFQNGLQMPLSQVWRTLSRFQNYSKLI